jgi:hypothetical protein
MRVDVKTLQIIEKQGPYSNWTKNSKQLSRKGIAAPIVDALICAGGGTRDWPATRISETTPVF